MITIEKVINRSCSADLIFKKKIIFMKLTMNTENALFLLAHHSFTSQDIKISFEYVDSYSKSN